MSYMMVEVESQGLFFSFFGELVDISFVDVMVVEVKCRWEVRGMLGEVGLLWISYFGDVDSYVFIYWVGSDWVILVGQGVYFKVIIGEVIYEELLFLVFFVINNFLIGLYLQYFEYWLL